MTIQNWMLSRSIVTPWPCLRVALSQSGPVSEAYDLAFNSNTKASTDNSLMRGTIMLP